MGRLIIFMVSNVAKAEYRSVLDQPNGNAVVIDFFQDHIMRDVDISKKTVVDWFSFCREVCVKIMIRQHEAA
ncbi:Delta(8)-fatty-acid desaturase 2 [Frankliniella fusca]|uniref:Delta(8)-fatty-acid desaturase 2 n=1 Tax=Frankliniella fusca TaxID=407009 RepID=A0AAE1GWD2_9NEOP|nr:Delta(8)-fatty-acid desaturase 2 [Frankliniella fusca]